MVESPRRDQLIPAIMVILLFDLTRQVSVLLAEGVDSAGESAVAGGRGIVDCIS